MTNSHLQLLDRALRKVKFYVPDVSLNLWRRRAVSCLSLLYKIFHNPKHMLHPCLYERFVPARLTRNVLSLNDLAFRIPRPRTEHYSRNVIHFYSRLWNILPDQVVQCIYKVRFFPRLYLVFIIISVIACTE